MSRTDEHLYKICLTALGRPRVVVPIGPDESTASLYERAAAEFRASVTALHSGVPPRLLPAHPHELVRSRIDNNARVIVTLAPSSAAATATTTATGRSSQRAAAKAATDSFAAVIAAQDAQDAATTSRSRRTQNAPASATGSAASAAKKLAKLPGRRLIDGATIEARTTNSTTGNSRTSRNNHSNSNSNKSSKRKMNSEEDVSTALLTALNHGGGGKVGQVLRGAMRNAVTHTYNASIALVRVAAVQANKYTITNNNNNNSNNNSLHVTFSKMTQGRGGYEEDVDYIPLDALQQVISAIHQSDPESLRPITLAQLSPRVFWSLLYHHRDEMASSGGNSTTNNIEHAYTTLLPNLNWAFLKKRKLTLSDKAKENLRQQQQQQQQLGTTEEDAENNNNNNNNMQAAQDAIQAVEHAMDSLHAYNADQRRNNAAQAALARATMTMNHHPTVDTATTTTTTTWELVTPTEEDRDELIACIGDDYQSNDGTVVDQLLRLQIYNWRMLANCTSSDLSKLLQQIPETTIDAWLDRAQQESIDEIMVEICNGNVQAVEALRDEAKSGTPKDLANWRMIPDMLLAATPSLQKVVSVPTLAEWCQRSHELLQQYSWLNWYATPVE